jgi:hypothetical protein
VSVASAQALLSAAASGMMALTGIVFAMAFVMAQFSAIVYSPRLVLWFARDRMLSTHWARSLQLSSMRCSRSPGWTAAARQRSRYSRCSRRGPDHCQHAPVFKVDAAPRRPSDRQRASPARRPGARRHRGDVPPPGRCRRPSSCQKRGEHGAARPRGPNGEVFWQTAHHRQARRRFPCRVGAGGTGDDRDGVRGRRYAG